MLRVLLAKDLRRAWRNPWPWLINLIVPLAMTALIGLAFGGRSDASALGRIRFAVVDEDQSMLSKFLRGAASQGEGDKYLEPVFLEREAALRQVNDNQLSAALIIPTNFTRHYLTGSQRVSLELVKNPAQSIHPTVLEELLGVVATGLNAISRNFQSEFPEWQEVAEGKGDYKKVAQLIERAGDKLKVAKEYVNPPLVIYEKGVRTEEKKPGDAKSGPAFNLFGFLLAGMSAMFLLFIANNGMSDLHREVRFRTFERYHTLRERLLPFVASKVVFTVVLVLLGFAVLLGGGTVVFRVHWQQPLALVALALAYAGFAAGLTALLSALVADERMAGMLNTVVGMALSLAGGCAFPPQNLPVVLRDHVTPLLPTSWFAETARNLLFSADAPWVFAVVKLAVVGAVLIGAAVWLFRRRFKAGLRA